MSINSRAAKSAGKNDGASVAMKNGKKSNKCFLLPRSCVWLDKILAQAVSHQNKHAQPKSARKCHLYSRVEKVNVTVLGRFPFNKTFPGKCSKKSAYFNSEFPKSKPFKRKFRKEKKSLQNRRNFLRISEEQRPSTPRTPRTQLALKIRGKLCCAKFVR